jgi:hypothetical protein
MESSLPCRRVQTRTKLLLDRDKATHSGRRHALTLMLVAIMMVDGGAQRHAKQMGMVDHMELQLQLSCKPCESRLAAAINT